MTISRATLALQRVERFPARPRCGHSLWPRRRVSGCPCSAKTLLLKLQLLGFFCATLARGTKPREGLRIPGQLGKTDKVGPGPHGWKITWLKVNIHPRFPGQKGKLCVSCKAIFQIGIWDKFCPLLPGRRSSAGLAPLGCMLHSGSLGVMTNVCFCGKKKKKKSKQATARCPWGTAEFLDNLKWPLSPKVFVVPFSAQQAQLPERYGCRFEK